MRILNVLLFAVASLLFAPLTVCAAPVDPSAAHAAAQEFVARRGQKLTASAVPVRARRAGSRNRQIPPYYIYNVEDNGGFVIVSGDDRTPRILGYTDDGNYVEDVLPDGLRELLADYAEQIERLDSLSAAPVAPGPLKSSVVYPARRYVAPLLPTLWNQKDPYNALCPIYNNSNGTSSGQRSATGCVATALGQIMGYYRYPEKTLKEIPSYTFSSGGSDIKMDAVSEGTVIDWPNISNVYTAASTAGQRNAVARLMVMVGTGCNMEYGAQSAANLQVGVQLLRDRLGYDEIIDYVHRRNYNQEDWVNLLYTEVANGRPVAYRATSASGGGHAFVIDGYDSGDLFHVNWGWGGTANGFFRISVLCTSETGAESTSNSSGYSLDQDAIVGVMPDDGVDSGRDAGQCLVARSMNVEGNRISAVYTNFSGSTMIASVGLGIVNADGTITQFGSTSAAWLRHNYEDTKTFTISGLADGIYRIVPVCKALSGSDWKPCVDVNREYVLATVVGGKVTLTLYPRDESMLSIGAWAFSGNFTKATRQVFKVAFDNAGSDYNGVLYSFASLTAAKGSATSKAGVAIPGGATEGVSFYFTPAAAGTYTVWIAKDDKGTDVVGSNTVTITETDQKVTNLSIGNVLYDNLIGNIVYGNSRKGTIVINNKGTADFDGKLVVKLYRGELGSNSMTSVSSQMVAVRVAAGAQTRVAFGFGNLSVNCKYGLRVMYEGEKTVVDNNPYVIYSRSQYPGVVSYSATGTTTASSPTSSFDAADAAAVDMRGVASIVRVIPSSNPNALYLLDAGATVPSGLEGLNVVKGSTAEKITLTDGYAVAIPYSFTAGEIRYSRQLAADSRSEQNWQSLALPFSPSEITCEGLPVTIDQSRLFVSCFAGLDASRRPVFSPSETIDDAVPYVIKAAGDLAGKTVTFAAGGVVVGAQAACRAMTADYDFIGTSLQCGLSSVYPLNGNGNAFDHHAETVQIQPFRAYFVSRLAPEAMAGSIVIEGVSSSIGAVTFAADEDNVDVYSLSGIRMGTTGIRNNRPLLTGFAPGVYIVKGVKVVKRR